MMALWRLRECSSLSPRAEGGRGMIELNEDTRFILGRPNFWCGSIARRLRELGHKIEEKAEEEQAYVIYLMLGLYEKHNGNDGWKQERRDLVMGKS